MEALNNGRKLRYTEQFLQSFTILCSSSIGYEDFDFGVLI